ncbi:dihydroneopterin aldolase [Anaerosporomusa subterranea]|jgi:dihydroneopterin aldolase|uniref:7,8-dihydroneopterin aldolase n=1 Tax=Anaerosporomusa subterranea TaxID=1794912 RepID=A0A154BU19_ANASB|nr:dihydroneopterin aldolase [Anaerosporomusa subterranea]KYZ77310.1 dihydroneopterin aldolase [Anaerosporomusa subterranea]MDF2501444.1 dihydroneopterin aldolase [Anaerosporomusa subterranea]
MHDTITLSNMTFFGRHGVYPYEQEHGQRFLVDIEMSADLEQAAQTDHLEATVDYTAVYDAVKRIVETEHYQLLEALCGRITGVVLEFPHVKRVVVRIRKPAAPVPGALDFVQVALSRSK